MEGRKLLGNIAVPTRLRTCFFLKKFSSGHMRSTAAGAIFTIAMADIIAFIAVSKAIRYGQLPHFTFDLLIMVISLLEAVCSVVWSMFWQHRRRRIMALSTLVPALTTLAWLFVPSLDISEETEFCSTRRNSLPDSGIPGKAAAVLSVAVITGIINAVSRAALWTHAVATLEENKPQYLSLGYGILITVRVAGLWVLPKMFSQDMVVWIMVLGTTIPQLNNVISICRSPIPTKDYEKDGSGISHGFWRVLSSGTAVGQIVAMSLLTSALWGYAVHEKQIIKTLFLVVEQSDFVSTQFDVLLVHVFIIAVILYGLVYSKPKIFDRTSAMKLATGASLIATAMYLVLGLAMTCSQGFVAGLNNSNYSIPTCSQHCGCVAPFSSFSPVCLPDTVTTYLSPCHAGCVGSDVISGLTAYRGCACAPAGGSLRALPGACAVQSCTPKYNLYRLLSAVVFVVTLLALTVQMVTVVRSVEPRDRSLAVGISSAAVLVSTFICTHIAYYFIGKSTCAWSENNICQFHTSLLPKLIGGISAVLTFVSLGICIVTFFILRAQSKRNMQQDVLFYAMHSNSRMNQVNNEDINATREDESNI